MVFLLDTWAADPDAALSIDYREEVEGAFAWAENGLARTRASQS